VCLYIDTRTLRKFGIYLLRFHVFTPIHVHIDFRDFTEQRVVKKYIYIQLLLLYVTNIQ